MNLGLKSNFCYRGARKLGAATLATTGNLSMRYFGFYERGHLGVICHRVTEIGKIEGTTADCKQAEALIDNIKAKVLLADRGYDSDAIVEKAEKAGMKAVIPPRKNRKIQREYDKELYKLRHFVENAFMILKRWRGVATRYAKNTASFLAAVQIRCIAAWVF